MAFVDSHAHLDDPAFASDLDAVLSRARSEGIARIVTIGTSLESSRRALALAERHADVWFAPGIHPHEADNPGPVEELKALAAHPRAVAVGETGLDAVKNYASIPNQRRLFIRHLEIAREGDRPVSIHCREAHPDTIAILRAHAPLRGVIHCFSGTHEDAEMYVALGFYLSIAGPVTYPKADGFREVVRQLPVDRLLLETDCPLLAPQPRRGKRNEPAYVRHTAEEVARLSGIPLDELGEATSENARRLFGWP
jgi:TatD DNase family protein